MSAIIYDAVDRGDLISGHTAGTEYSFDVPLKTFNRSIKRKQNSAVSLSGRRITTLHHIKNTYTVETIPLNGATDLANMREFLTSVVGGEQFTIDAYGTVATPNNQQEVILIGDINENLVDVTGFYSFSFRVEAV